MGAKPTLCGRKRNDRFRDGTRGNLPFAGIVPADLFCPVPLVEIWPACAINDGGCNRRCQLGQQHIPIV